VCADAIESAGADRVVTMDLHAPQVQGFFRVPVDDLYGAPVLCDAVRTRGLRDLVVVAPDAGFAKKARSYASRLDAPLAIADKRRVDHSERPEVLEIMGDVRGRTALLVDDFTISAGTLTEAARMLTERGASAVYAAVSHGVFAHGSMERIDSSPIESVFVTDTVEGQPVALSPKITTVTVAPLFGEAIRRIHRRESISVLFE
jgi:ribose-phosphate pyrophosphokinase